jgi:transglutaminase-like putative cysteine protease
MEFLSVNIPEDVLRAEYEGNYREAEGRINKYLEGRLPAIMRQRLEYEFYRISRIKKNYCYTLEAAKDVIKNTIKDITDEEFDNLLKDKKLDLILFEGDPFFEKRFADNLCFADKNYMQRKILDEKREKGKELLHNRLNELLKGDSPKAYKVRGRITKIPKVIPFDAKTIKCWLPLPKSDLQQRASSWIKTDISDFTVSRNNHPQRTFFAQKTVDPASKNAFSVEFEYRITEIISNVDPDMVRLPKINMDTYFEEQNPQIIFTPYLKKLASEIVKDERNPYLGAKKIYDWITLNVNYSFMKEYKYYGNLPEYAATNLKGDCGVQALLFITLCRICRIPARWQSGWYANPLSPGNHDWALFYCEPYGWLPADCSFGGARRNKEEYREFYFGNLDAFRMVTTTGFMSPFFPEKKFMRNDPYDNQSGEMETERVAIEEEDTIHLKEILEFTSLSDISERDD